MALMTRYKEGSERICSVCRKKVSKGNLVPIYKEDLPFICNECSRTYLKETERSEGNSLFIRFRPAEHRRNECDMPQIVFIRIIKEMISWILTGAALAAALRFMESMSPADERSSLPVSVVMGAYVLVTALFLLRAVRNIIYGLLRGMDLKRIIMLVLQAGEYIFIAIRSIDFITNRR